MMVEMDTWCGLYDPDTGASPEAVTTIRTNREEFIAGLRSKF